MLKGKDQNGELDVLVLDEAMDKKLVKIKENPSQTVNHLTLVNDSQQPLFLLAGEVILGGKQDRIIGANTVIPAKTTQVVPVFCVEHGRWDNSGTEFVSAKALAHGRLRGKASFESQGDVWREVAEKNRARKTENSTDTYRNVAQQQRDGTLATWNKQIKGALGRMLPGDRKRMIGYVIALNGKVATVDMFTSPNLFGKLEDKLLRSYATEAVDIKAVAAIKAPTVADVKAFIADANKAPEEPKYDSGVAATTISKGKFAGKSKVELKGALKRAKPTPATSEPAKDADSDDKPLYENYQMH